MLTFTLGGVYSIVDGVFVGHAVGDAGVAGHQRGVPAGGVRHGRGHGRRHGRRRDLVHRARRRATRRSRGAPWARRSRCSRLAARARHGAAAVTLADAHLRALLGGPGRARSAQAAAYTGVIAWGVPFQILVTGCTPLIRNQGRVGLRDGGAGVRGPDERGAWTTCSSCLLGMGHRRRRGGHGGVAGGGVSCRCSGFFLMREEPHRAWPTCGRTGKIVAACAASWGWRRSG